MTESFDIPLDVSGASMGRLARGLLFERGSAEDVLQEAWVAALERRGEVRSLGAWFSGTVKQLVRNRARAEERRRRRERASARPEAEPAAVDAAARIEITRTLLEAVERLDEPYRAAIVLHFFDELPPRESARRLGLPVNTVRTHVRRGLARLRSDLEARVGGDRDVLLAAMLPLLDGEGPGGEGLAKEIARLPRHGLAAAVGAASLIAIVAWGVLPSRGKPGTDGERGVASTAGAPDPSSPLTTPSPRMASAGSERSTPAGREHLEFEWVVRGRLTNRAGVVSKAPLVGRVFAGPEPKGPVLLEERLEADARGEFAWPVTPPSTLMTVELRCELADAIARPVSRWCLPGDPAPTDLQLYVFPFDCFVRGVVRDEEGQPLADARVGARLGQTPSVASGADGTFEFPWASSQGRLRDVYAWLPGRAPARADGGTLVPGGQLECELYLWPEVHMDGRVLDEEGAPVVGATITLEQFVEVEPVRTTIGAKVSSRTGTGRLLSGWPTAVSDESGRFEIGGIDARAEVLLMARASGFLPEKRHFAGLGEGTSGLDIRLSRGATLSGRVLAGGSPVEWAWVYVGSLSPEGPVQAWTDAEGRFALPNVPFGAQVLWCWRRGHAKLRHDLLVVGGGSEIVLDLPDTHFLGGQVLDANGEGLPWAALWAEDADSANAPALEGFEDWTDAQGRFRFDDLPLRPIRLSVHAPGHESWSERVGEIDRDDLVLRLESQDPPPEPVAPTPVFEPVPIVPVSASSGRGHLEGRLLDAAGSARAHRTMRLAALESPLGELHWHSTTDENGRYVFDALPAGTLSLAWEQREGEHSVVDLERPFVLAEDEFRTLDLQAVGGTHVYGTVSFLQALPGEGQTVSHGAPAVLGDPPEGMPALIEILLRPSGVGQVPWTCRGTFARDGYFELEGLEPGRYSAEATLVQSNGKRSHGMSFVTVPAQPRAEVAVRILRPQ